MAGPTENYDYIGTEWVELQEKLDEEKSPKKGSRPKESGKKSGILNDSKIKQKPSDQTQNLESETVEGRNVTVPVQKESTGGASPSPMKESPGRQPSTRSPIKPSTPLLIKPSTPPLIKTAEEEKKTEVEEGDYLIIGGDTEQQKKDSHKISEKSQKTRNDAATGDGEEEFETQQESDMLEKVNVPKKKNIPENPQEYMQKPMPRVQKLVEDEESFAEPGGGAESKESKEGTSESSKPEDREVIVVGQDMKDRFDEEKWTDMGGVPTPSLKDGRKSKRRRWLEIAGYIGIGVLIGSAITAAIAVPVAKSTC